MKKLLLAAACLMPLAGHAHTNAVQLDCGYAGIWRIDIGASEKMVAVAWAERLDTKLSDTFNGRASPSNVNVERLLDGKTQQILIDRITLQMTQIIWADVSKKEDEKVFDCRISAERKI